MEPRGDKIVGADDYTAKRPITRVIHKRLSKQFVRMNITA